MRASFQDYYNVLKRNPYIFRIKGTSLCNIVPYSGLRKFRHGISIVDVLLTYSRKVDAHSVINWTVVCQLS